jgi:hypothetical protein
MDEGFNGHPIDLHDDLQQPGLTGRSSAVAQAISTFHAVHTHA